MLFDPGFEPLQLVAISSCLVQAPLVHRDTLVDRVFLPFPRVDVVVYVYTARLLVHGPG